MEEKRRAKRMKVDMMLEISNLFKQANISKSGIGFESKADLPVGYYFNAKIELGGSENALFAVIQIIRSEKREDSMFYGCQFIGMAPVLEFIFDEYEKTLND